MSSCRPTFITSPCCSFLIFFGDKAWYVSAFPQKFKKGKWTIKEQLCCVKAHDPWPLIAIIQDLTVSQIIESDDQWFWQIPRNAMLNRCSVHCSYPFWIWKCKRSCLDLHIDLENSGHWLFCATLISSKCQRDSTNHPIVWDSPL